MDKFGIFKLLNSFFNFYGQKPPENQTENSDNGGQSFFAVSNLLKSLNNNSGTNNFNPSPTKPEQKSPPAFMPLQANMLKTMSSHDEFIKRVKQKNPQ